MILPAGFKPVLIEQINLFTGYIQLSGKEVG
jgi:hypothetical protein